MKPTYTRRRRPPAHREAVAFKKESQQEPSFFGQTGHAPFFQPAVAMTQTGIRRKCAGCEAEVKAQRKEKAQEQETVQRAPVKEEEKLQRMEANKEKEETVQRMTGAKEEEKVQRAVEEKKEETVQKKEAGPSAAPPHTASAYIGGIHGKGQPFSSATRQFYEKRMGADFGNVRIHTDPDAAASAKEINARAYTYGHHIVFNEDQYRPETSDGGHLLAHELAHVMQQSGKTANKAFRLPGPGGEETVHAGMAESYRERRGVPASGREESGLAVGPSDWEIIHRLAPSIARLVQELRTAYSTGGTAALFARMRTLTPLQRLEPELADFVAVTLVGNELWAANLLLRYGPETAWPARWRVRRELLLLPGGGGAAQAMAALGSASEAEKIAIINDSVTMDLIRALNATARQQLGAALINLGAVPTGSAQNATAELLLSSVVIERNTALRIANGDIRIFYMENLTHAANEAAILASMGLNPAQFAVYNYPDGSPNTVNVQLNAIGFRINGANIICGQRALDISRWRTLLIHETNHARNPSPVTPLDNYQVEFRAYWLAEFSNIADLADRARQIKAHILRDYPLIRAAYDNDATVRAAIDAHTRPVGNLTNE